MTILHHTFRTRTVEPGGICYVIFPSGAVSISGVANEGYNLEPILPDGWTFHVPSNYGSSGNTWYRQWLWGITVSASAVPGDYNVYFRSGTGAQAANPPIPIRVLPTQPVRPVKYISRGGRTLNEVQRFLNEGYNIELSPREHIWNLPLTVPSGATIFSTGATITRTNDGDDVSYAYHMFYPNGSMVLRGLKLNHDDTVPYYTCYLHHNDGYWAPDAPNITVEYCTIMRGNLHRAHNANTLVRKCVFDRATTGQVPLNCAYIDNKFYGHTRTGEHSFFATAGSGIIAVNNIFQDTNRGMVFQTGWFYGCIIMDNHFHNIRGGEGNAGECILFELGVDGTIIPSGSNGARENIILQNWITNCSGPGVIFYGTGIHDNMVYETLLDTDGQGIYVASLPGHGWNTNNQFHNNECHSEVYFHGKVGINTFSNTQFIKSSPKIGNAGRFKVNYLLRVENYPFHLDDTARASGTYNFSNCGFVTNSGYYDITSINFTASGCV